MAGLKPVNTNYKNIFLPSDFFRRLLAQKTFFRSAKRQIEVDCEKSIWKEIGNQRKLIIAQNKHEQSFLLACLKRNWIQRIETKVKTRLSKSYYVKFRKTSLCVLNLVNSWNKLETWARKILLPVHPLSSGRVPTVEGVFHVDGQVAILRIQKQWW